MDVAQIEQKLTRRPHSPLFARLADDYLRSGMMEPARELLLSGLEKYPSYASAHLVLARCYAHGKDYPSALRHLRISISALPAVDHLLALAEEWEANALARRSPALPEPMLPDFPVVETAPEPAQSAAVPGSAAPALPAPALPAAAEAPIVPARPMRPILAPVLSRPRPAPVRPGSGRIEDGRIVSKTLAEIYAMQGEYGEAIITYTMLKHHRPQMAAECDLRISELEQALQAKLNQQKLALSK